MPRGFKVLFPARIRTPARPGGRFGADTLLGFGSFRPSVLRPSGSRLPGTFPRAPSGTVSERRIERRFRALPTTG